MFTTKQCHFEQCVIHDNQMYTWLTQELILKFSLGFMHNITLFLWPNCNKIVFVDIWIKQVEYMIFVMENWEEIVVKVMSFIEKRKDIKLLVCFYCQNALPHTTYTNSYFLIQSLCFYFSLFQHYKLFEFMFSHTQAEEIIGTDVSTQYIIK